MRRCLGLRLLTISALCSALALLPLERAWAKLPEAEVNQYIQQLQASDPNTRYKAIATLGKNPNEAKTAIPALTTLLTDPDPAIREAAAQALGRICSATKFVTPEVVIGLKEVALKDKGMNVGYRAAEALRDIEANAPGTLLKLYPTLVSESIKELGKSSSEFSDGAAYTLGQLQSRLKNVTPALLTALQSKEPAVRASAAHAFQYTDFEAQVISAQLVVPQLLKGLKDNYPEVRNQSANSLRAFFLEARTIIPNLIQTIYQDSESKVRKSAIRSLVEINERLKEINSESIDKAKSQISKEKDHGKLTLYKNALAKIQDLNDYKDEALSSTLKTLKSTLEDRDDSVSSSSIYSLCSLSKDGRDVIPLLIKIISNQSPDISRSRREAASALDKCTGNLDTLISIMPDLVKFLGDPEIHYGISDSLAEISETLQDDAQKLSDKKLEKVILNLEKALTVYKDKQDEFERKHIALSNKNEARISRSLLALQRERDLRFSKKVAGILQKNPWLPAIPAIPTAYGIILWLRPRWLLLLPASLTLPKVGKISPKIILWLKYRPRVMDTWITYHLGTLTLKEADQPRAKIRFGEIETVSRHQTYIPLPLRFQVNNQTNRHESLPLATLQQIFRENTIQLLICGEGGIGKTSLACHLAKLAMADTPSLRLCKQHPMLPIFIEPELIEQELKLQSSFPTETTRKDDDSTTRTWDNLPSQPLIEAIRKQLQFLINEQEPISDELLKQLLQSGRILIIVDRYSEMSDNARQTIDPTSKTYPINALILTSRQSEKIGNITPDRIEPLQLTGSELMRFMEEYLKTTQNIELSQQPKLYQACENLQQIVEARGKPIVTVLLAKLAADQLIAGKPLPTSIPDLMLKSLDLINEQVKKRFDNRIVRRDAQALAWACLQSPTAPYRPSAANLTTIQEILEKLDSKSDVNQRLKYLAEELRIIERVGETKDEIRIVLDPMAEYLAGLHLVTIYSTDETAWQEFLLLAAEFDKIDIQGFMLAVQDCCRVASAEGKVTAKIVDEFKTFTS